MGNKSSSSSSQPTQQQLQQISNLVSMGFTQHASQNALRSCNGNFDAALAALLNPSSNSSNSSNSSTNSNSNSSSSNTAAASAALSRATDWRQNASVSPQRKRHNNSNGASGNQRRVGANANLTADEALARALAESMQSSSVQSTKPSSSSTSTSNSSSNSSFLTKQSNPSTKSTTKSNSSNTIDLTSEKLAPKGLSRLAKVLAPHPIAMDTVIKIIRTILTNPNNPKYRSMKWENKRFAETVKGAPGAIDFLKKIGFVDDKSNQALTLRTVDEGVLLVAMQMLQKQRRSTVYKSEVGKIEFDTVVQALLGRTPDSSEIIKRKTYSDKVPNLPIEKQGTQTLVRITLGAHTVDRRFRTDNTLNAAINYLGSLSSLIPTKIDNGEWILINTTTFPEQILDLNIDRNKTFYALEMWPSAWLELRAK